MYPDWVNMHLNINESNAKRTYNEYNKDVEIVHNYNYDSSDDIMREIGFFIMTRIIDNKFNDVPCYRRCVNNPYHRALWHIASCIDFMTVINYDHLHEHDNFNEKIILQNKFFSFLDVFCLLSRVKSSIEFEDSFNRYHRNITNITPEIIPMWIYDRCNHLESPYIYSKLPHLSHMSLLKKIGATEIYDLLCKKFSEEPNCIFDKRCNQYR